MPPLSVSATAHEGMSTTVDNTSSAVDAGLSTAAIFAIILGSLAATAILTSLVALAKRRSSRARIREDIRWTSPPHSTGRQNQLARQICQDDSLGRQDQGRMPEIRVEGVPVEKPEPVVYGDRSRSPSLDNWNPPSYEENERLVRG